jgi:hypothetical protein
MTGDGEELPPSKLGTKVSFDMHWLKLTRQAHWDMVYE